MNNLVIVESPTKARTLQRFLGNEYQIEASMGHVRDLPKSELGVDVERDFEPQYIIPRDKRKRVNELKKTAANAKTLWLATDPDREGEAIAWHLVELLRNEDIKRVVFHEITEEAVKQAFTKPRDLDMQLIDAQQARRVLDRLVGYKLSPLLWQKVKRGLSAGRVQTVALRLIVEREREITAFKSEEYWIIEAELKGNRVQGTGDSFIAILIEKNGKKITVKNEKEAKAHTAILEKSNYLVSKVSQKEIRRYPYPPFITSTMQQASSNRLGFSAKKTMTLAQALYERGLITYMRTDSVNLSSGSLLAVRNYILQNFGRRFIPPTPKAYKSKSKNAQEAHEAIRPTDAGRTLSLAGTDAGLTRDHARLYELIWKRFVACQMSEALLDQTTVDIKAFRSTSEVGFDSSEVYLLRVTGSVIKFEGWLKLYQGDGEDEKEDGKILPELNKDEELKLIQLLPGQHFTEAPPRYTEASLIKKLEELGVGRPSTYAPILSTIQERFYVEKIEKKFIPTILGFAVCDFLIKYFPDVFDYQFTAQMEDKLDEIARGERQWRPTILEFYEPFEKKLEATGQTAERVKVAVEYAGKICPECGKDLIVRVGRFGKFLACSGFPDCKHTENLDEIINVKCPDDGGDIVVRRTRRGKTFYGCKNWPVCKFASWTKPKGGDREQATGDSGK